jgi:hypothetical protein
MPLAHDDEPRTGYVRASEIAPVLHMHPRRYEAELNDPLTGTRATRPSQLSVFVSMKDGPMSRVGLDSP